MISEQILQNAFQQAYQIDRDNDGYGFASLSDYLAGQVKEAEDIQQTLDFMSEVSRQFYEGPEAQLLSLYRFLDATRAYDTSQKAMRYFLQTEHENLAATPGVANAIADSLLKNDPTKTTLPESSTGFGLFSNQLPDPDKMQALVDTGWPQYAYGMITGLWHYNTTHPDEPSDVKLAINNDNVENMLLNTSKSLAMLDKDYIASIVLRAAEESCVDTSGLNVNKPGIQKAFVLSGFEDSSRTFYRLIHDYDLCIPPERFESLLDEALDTKTDAELVKITQGLGYLSAFDAVGGGNYQSWQSSPELCSRLLELGFSGDSRLNLEALQRLSPDELLSTLNNVIEKGHYNGDTVDNVQLILSAIAPGMERHEKVRSAYQGLYDTAGAFLVNNKSLINMMDNNPFSEEFHYGFLKSSVTNEQDTVLAGPNKIAVEVLSYASEQVQHQLVRAFPYEILNDKALLDDVGRQSEMAYFRSQTYRDFVLANIEKATTSPSPRRCHVRANMTFFKSAIGGYAGVLHEQALSDKQLDALGTAFNKQLNAIYDYDASENNRSTLINSAEYVTGALLKAAEKQPDAFREKIVRSALLHDNATLAISISANHRVLNLLTPDEFQMLYDNAHLENSHGQLDTLLTKLCNMDKQHQAISIISDLSPRITAATDRPPGIHPQQWSLFNLVALEHDRLDEAAGKLDQQMKYQPNELTAAQQHDNERTIDYSGMNR